MLYVRDIVRLPGKRLMRIIGHIADDAVLFDLDATKTVCERHNIADLARAVDRGKCILVTGDKHDRPCRVVVSKKRSERANILLKAIMPILSAGPKAFDQAARGHLISSAAKASGLSATTLRKSLFRYWKWGMTIEALLPDFDRCGGAGRERAGTVPLGRPGPPNAPPAPRITTTILEAFEKGTNRYYRNNARNTLAEAYRLICDDIQTECIFDPATGAPLTFLRHGADTRPVPTIRQYRYWYKKQKRSKDDIKARMPESKYEQRHRAMLSYAAQDNHYIGGRYVIDSTPLDLNLVSRLNDSIFLGTPTLYFVVDEFTAFIAGFALSLEDASWTAASLAMLNAVEDKVSFCSKYGIAIGNDDWPVADLIAMRLLFDRGEAKGKLADAFGRKSSIIIENTTPYRGDLKGIGEQRFDLVNDALRGMVPGYRAGKAKERGEKDVRCDATLDLDQAVSVIIHTILFLNSREVPEFRRSRAMIQDEIAPIPIEMWNWARLSGRSALVRRSYEDMVFALMPTGSATITQQGLAFEGLFYTCQSAEEAGWFECLTSPARLRKRTVSFHPWLVDIIYVHGPDKAEPEIAVLTPHSSRYAGLSFEELAKTKLYERGNARNRKNDQILKHANFSNNVKQIVSESNQRRLSRFKPKDLMGSRAAKSAEREFDREDHRDVLRDVASSRFSRSERQPAKLPRPTAFDCDLGEGGISTSGQSFGL